MEKSERFDDNTRDSTKSTAGTEDGQDCCPSIGQTVEESQSYDSEREERLGNFVVKLVGWLVLGDEGDGIMPFQELQDKLKNGLAKLQEGKENLLEVVEVDFNEQDLIFKEQCKAIQELVKPLGMKKLGDFVSDQDFANMVTNMFARLKESLDNLDPKLSAPKFVEGVQETCFLSVFEMMSKVVSDLNK